MSYSMLQSHGYACRDWRGSFRAETNAIAETNAGGPYKTPGATKHRKGMK